MKRISRVYIAALALVLLVFGSAQGGKNIIRNGNFEKFTGGEPAGWETTNIPNMLTAVSQSTNYHSGKSAVRCEVKDFSGTKMAGMLCLKNLRLSGSLLQLKGFYLLHPVGNDVGFLSVTFKNTNNSTIGSVEEFLSKSTGGYVLVTREAKIPNGTTMMDLHLTILAGKGSNAPHEGSYVLIDDLEGIVTTEEAPTH